MAPITLAHQPVTDSVAPLIDAAHVAALPTSSGVFKPVGHVMLGVPSQAQVTVLALALRDAGWPAASVQQFSPTQSGSEFQAMADGAGPLAGFGYEITLLQRYVTLTADGYRWLLVQAEDAEHASRAAQIARASGATQAVYYKSLTIEELIA
jgi:hypothetical protein